MISYICQLTSRQAGVLPFYIRKSYFTDMSFWYLHNRSYLISLSHFRTNATWDMLSSTLLNLKKLSHFIRYSLLLLLFLIAFGLLGEHWLKASKKQHSQAFNGKKWEKFNSEKVATLTYARIQGKTALIAHFQNSSLMNEDKRCRPILFHTDGPNAGDQVN